MGAQGETPTNTTPKKPNKIATCLKAIYIIVMAFYGIYGLFLAYRAYAEFRDLSKGYNNIIENWREDIITDIALVDTNSACPTGYTNEFRYHYGGSKVGCDCRAIVSHPDLDAKVYTKVCNTTMTAASCIPKAAHPGRTLTGVGSTTTAADARQVCIERGSTNFIEVAEELDSTGACKSGFTECGDSTDPTKLKLMCIPNSLGGCPIMDIGSGADSATGGSVTLNWDRTPTTSGDLPISELVISVDQVCQNDNNNAKEVANANGWPLRVTGNKNQNSCEGGTDSSFVSFFT